MRKTIVLLAAVALAIPAMADLYTSEVGSGSVYDAGPRDDIIWDNIPSGQVDLAYLASSQWAPSYPFRSGVADDFLCGDDPTMPYCYVTDVHWWGGYWNYTTAYDLADGFLVNIYEDDGGKPTGSGMEDPTPTAICSWTLTDYTETFLETDRYEYSAVLDPPCVLDCEGYYWLEIVAIDEFPPQWGWASSLDQQMATAKQGFPLLSIPFWEQDLALDMAFQLTGYCVPEPTALSLLALGGLALLRRR